MGAEKPKYVFSKIFTGSYLNEKIGHETKNFIVDDNGNRWVYVNPYGSINKNKEEKLEWVIHVIDSSNIEKSLFEIVAISKIDKDVIPRKSPTLNGFKFVDIYKDNNPSTFGIGYKSEAMYVPKNNKRVFIQFDSQDSNKICNEKNYLVININARWGQCNHMFPKNNDEDVLDKVIKNIDKWFEFSTSTNEILNNQNHMELPLCIISGRTSLEDSLSNQIAYFARRDSKLLKLILKKMLNINDLDKNESFEIIRERDRIDILIESNKRVIVIENKVDSNINGIKSSEISQLTKYYEIINKNYPNHKKHFYILMPEYSDITDEKKSRH